MSGPSSAATTIPTGRHAGSTARRSLDLVAQLQGLTVALPLRHEADRSPEPSGAALLALAESSGFRGSLLPVGPRELQALDLRRPAILRQADGRCRVLASAAMGSGSARGGLAGGGAASGGTARGGASPVLVVDPERPADPPERLDGIATALPPGLELLLLRPAEAVALDNDPPVAGSWRDGLGQAFAAMPGLGRDLALSGLMLGVLSLATVLIAAGLLDAGTRGDSAVTVVALCIALGVVATFEAAFRALRDRLTRDAATTVGLQREATLLSRLLDRAPARWRATPAGQDAEEFAFAASLRTRAAAPPLAGAAEALATVLVFGAAMAWCSPRLAAVTGAIAGVGLLASLPLRLRLRRAAAPLASTDDVPGADPLPGAEAARSAVLVRALASARTVRRRGLEAQQRRQWDDATARVTRLRLAEARTMRPLSVLGLGLERALVLVPFGIGAAWAMAPGATVSGAALVVFLLLSWRVAAPLRRLGLLVADATTARLALQAGAAFARNEPPQGRAATPDHPGAAPPVVGRIDVADLDFTYSGAPASALRAVAFRLPAGGTLGVLGRSGAGKSTLARLLNGSETGHAGLIKIDGIDIRDLAPAHLARAVAVVDGDTPLMAGRLGHVLRLAAPGATAERVETALRLAGATILVAHLPEGLDTPVGETSAPLSDSERQRLLLAQALVADPRILVLDEALSALDPVAERDFARSLPAIAAGRTLVLITPRLSLLRHMDAILVLDRGEVQDVGSHRELMARSDLYSGSWARQHAALPRPAAPPPALQRPAP